MYDDVPPYGGVELRERARPVAERETQHERLLPHGAFRPLHAFGDRADRGPGPFINHVDRGERPAQEARHPPVRVTEQLHDRGHKNHADHGRVDKHGDGEAEAEHVENSQRVVDDE